MKCCFLSFCRPKKDDFITPENVVTNKNNLSKKSSLETLLHTNPNILPEIYIEAKEQETNELKLTELTEKTVEKYQPITPYVLYISLPPGSYTQYCCSGRKNITLKMPTSAMPCYCSAFFLSQKNNVNNNFKQVILEHLDIKGSSRQHIHRAKIQYHKISTPKQLIIKFSYSEVEYSHLNYINNAKFFDNQSPTINVISSCKWLPTPDSDFVWLLLLEEGPKDFFEFLSFLRSKKDDLTIKQVVEIMFGLLIQVCKIHDINIAHLDISIENVLYNPVNGETKLIDFEVSQYLNPDEEFHFNINKDKLKNNGLEEVKQSEEYLKFLNDKGYIAQFGKTQCMSIEQLTCKPANGFQIDVYTLGIMMFQLFFIHPPYKHYKDRWASWFFEPTKGMKKLVYHLHSTKYLEFIENPWFENFILICCQADLKKRPKNARELLRHPLFKECAQRSELLQRYIKNENNEFTEKYQSETFENE